MKILMANYEFPPIGGGGANANLALLREFAGRDDIEVDLITSGARFSCSRFADNITVHTIGIRKKELHYWRKREVIEWLIKAGPYYRKLIEGGDYDLAHAFFGFPTGWLCWRNAGKLPYIISLRGSDVPGQNPRLKIDYNLLSPVFKWIWNRSVCLAACSEGLKQRALNFMDTDKIEVIPNGVNLEEFRPAKQKPEMTPLRLITVGRLSETKRVDKLIRAIETFKKQDIHLILTIVGTGALIKQLEQMVSDRNLNDQIEMTGRVSPEQMPELYENAHIYVSATMQEGMSNAMLEAMASGLPIVTTRCEGVEELIDGNGIVLDDAEPESFAAAIKSLSSNPDKYQMMSERPSVKHQSSPGVA